MHTEIAVLLVELVGSVCGVQNRLMNALLVDKDLMLQLLLEPIVIHCLMMRLLVLRLRIVC